MLLNRKTVKIETKFLHLLPIYNDNETSNDNTSKKVEGSTGEHYFRLTLNYFNDNEIPVENLIGFAADGASNFKGKHTSFTSRLREVAPRVTVLKCFCHSIHLCASQAAKILPRMCEDLIRNIYTYFSHDAKRKCECGEYQSFCEVKPHKLLHVSQTKWLSLQMVVDRIPLKTPHTFYYATTPRRLTVVFFSYF